MIQAITIRATGSKGSFTLHACLTPPLCREQRRFAVASRNQRLVMFLNPHAATPSGIVHKPGRYTETCPRAPRSPAPLASILTS